MTGLIARMPDRWPELKFHLPGPAKIDYIVKVTVDVSRERMPTMKLFKSSVIDEQMQQHGHKCTFRD